MGIWGSVTRGLLKSWRRRHLAQAAMRWYFVPNQRTAAVQARRIVGFWPGSLVVLLAPLEARFISGLAVISRINPLGSPRKSFDRFFLLSEWILIGFHVYFVCATKPHQPPNLLLVTALRKR